MFLPKGFENPVKLNSYAPYIILQQNLWKSSEREISPKEIIVFRLLGISTNAVKQNILHK